MTRLRFPALLGAATMSLAIAPTRATLAGADENIRQIAEPGACSPALRDLRSPERSI